MENTCNCGKADCPVCGMGKECNCGKADCPVCGAGKSSCGRGGCGHGSM